MPLDIICRRNLVDVEVDGRHTLINRFWNPQGDRFGVSAEDSPLTMHNLVIRPLSTMKTAETLQGDETSYCSGSGVTYFPHLSLSFSRNLPVFRKSVIGHNLTQGCAGVEAAGVAVVLAR